MTVLTLITEVSRDLNDQEVGNEFVRWTQADLLEFAYDACVQIALLKPDAAAHTETITLVPGEEQSLGQDCHTLSDITFNVDASGKKTDGPNMSDYDTMRSVRRRQCAPKDGTYKAVNFAVDKNNRTKFYVSPPVPDTVPPTVARVEVVCSGIKSPLLLTDEVPVASAYHTAVVHYMLYRAHSRDEESVGSVTRARAFLQEFYNTLRVRVLQEQVMKKEEKEMA